MELHNSFCQLCHLDSIYPILGDRSVCYCVVNVLKNQALHSPLPYHNPTNRIKSLDNWKTSLVVQ